MAHLQHDLRNRSFLFAALFGQVTRVGARTLTPFRPIASSGSALIVINLKPARVIPFPSSPISRDVEEQNQGHASCRVGILKDGFDNRILFSLTELDVPIHQ